MVPKYRRFAVAAMTVALSSGVAHAAPDAAFEAASRQFSGALAGDSAAIDLAADAFDTLLKAEPTNPLLMSYAGASTTLKARNTVMPWKKMSLAEDGLAQIDKALSLLGPAHEAPLQRGVPGALETRFVAANTFLAVPGFMNRGARGAKLLADVLKAPAFAGAPPGFKGQVWLRAAALARAEARDDDARRLLEAVVFAGAPQADVAKTQLKEITR